MPDYEISAGASNEVFESFYLETRDGLVFAVKGHEHPPDRWIGVLRYVPDSNYGDRIRNEQAYRRLYGFAEQEERLQKDFPQYLSYDPVFQTRLQSVPRLLTRRIYDPRLRLFELIQAQKRTSIEEDAVDFADLLRKEAGIPSYCIGITGSLLIGLNTDNSDLDIAVFGAHNSVAVYLALRKLVESKSCKELSRLDPKKMEDLYRERSADTEMAFYQFEKLERGKVNQGVFRDRTYFIRFIKEPGEIGYVYGDQSYQKLGRATIRALVSDDREAIFTPCRYLLSRVHSLQGPSLPDLAEIVSFRGRFCQQARVGDCVIATGSLERVQHRSGTVWHRLLLGGSREDTMLVC